MPHFNIYGLDHSPWVQAVLLGLHDKQVPHTLRLTPPLAHFVKAGVTMPAASVDGAPWQLESADILVRAGYAPIAKEDLDAVFAAWRGVLHRADSVPDFLTSFSRVRDHAPSAMGRMANQYLRSFASFYFMLLIRTVRGRAKDPEDFGDQFLYWEHRLNGSDDPFLGGEAPDLADLMLFGVVQCHATTPVPPLQSLRHDERLPQVRAWIGRMQQRFATYDHLYSGRFFEPKSSSPPKAPASERLAFWLGMLTWIALFPITVPAVFLLARRRDPTPSTGAPA